MFLCSSSEGEWVNFNFLENDQSKGSEQFYSQQYQNETAANQMIN